MTAACSRTFAPFAPAHESEAAAVWSISILAFLFTLAIVSSTSGFNWSAVYDGLGRRLQTSQQTVTSGTTTGTALVLKSSYDPDVEFMELAVTAGTQRDWLVHGPDMNGRYGALQGTGGIEAIYNATTGVTTGVICDNYGHAEATVNSSGVVSWNPVTSNGYGVAPGSAAAVPMDASHDLSAVLAWRGHYIDGTGYYYLGARYYAPDSGTFLSPDPLGHAASMSLYDYCNGDPVNGLDPDGRCAKGFGTGVSNGASNLWGTATGLAGSAYSAVTNPQQAWTSAQNTWNDITFTASGVMSGLRNDPSGMAEAALDGLNTGANNLKTQFSTPNGAGQFFGGVAFTAATIEVGGGLSKLGGASAVTEAAETTAPRYVQMEFPFARGASVQTPGVTTAGETFVRVGARPQNLKFGSTSLSGAQPGTYAFPQATFDAIGQNPAALKNFGDLPGVAPQYFRTLSPPAGTPIQRGIVPGGQYGGVGGVEEVIFPKGF